MPATASPEGTWRKRKFGDAGAEPPRGENRRDQSAHGERIGLMRTAWRTLSPEQRTALEGQCPELFQVFANQLAKSDRRKQHGRGGGNGARGGGRTGNAGRGRGRGGGEQQ